MEPVKLCELNKGIVEELFQNEFQKVLDNIKNKKTDWKDKRVIKIEVEITPDGEREIGYVGIKCTSKLADERPKQTVMHIRDNHGKWFAFEDTRVQGELFDDKGVQDILNTKKR